MIIWRYDGKISVTDWFFVRTAKQLFAERKAFLSRLHVGIVIETSISGDFL